MEKELNPDTTEIKYRHDWYQTDSHVIISLFIKNVNKDKLKIIFEEKQICICIDQDESSKFTKKFLLWDCIRPSESSYKVYATKIEIKVKKNEFLKWKLLEQSEGEQIGVKSDPVYPSSSKKKHDWGKLEAEVKRDEEVEKPEGDAALNQLFQKIYSDGSEEVRKAMNKSFMESGGTVLSTNWKEVKEKNVDVKAPDGMEWKTWDK